MCNRCPPGAWCTGGHTEEIGLCQRVVNPYIPSLGRWWVGALHTYSDGGATGPYSEWGPSTCRLCKPGHYMGGTPGIFCEPAPPGSFVPEPFGSTRPTLCPPGTYQSDPAQTSCSPCNGTGVPAAFAAVPGRAACDRCAPGFHVPPHGASCEPCPAGHRCPDGGPKRPCNAGNYQPDVGQSQCRTCRETHSGYTPDDGGSYEECLTCPPENFVPFGDRKACSACWVGLACSGTTDRRPCFGGHYSPREGLSECLQCPMGTISYTTYTNFGQLLGETSCHACPPGTFADDTRTQCVPCFPGTFCPNGSVLLPCAGGYFSAGYGNKTCAACGEGSYTPPLDLAGEDEAQESWFRAVRAGHTFCLPCTNPGLFVEEQEPPYKTCSPCTPGYSCAGGRRSPCHGGNFSSGLMAHTCEACPNYTFTPRDGVAKTGCTPCPADRPVQNAARDGCVAREPVQHSSASSSGTSLSQGPAPPSPAQGWWACGTVVGLQDAVDVEYPSAECAIAQLREADASYSSVLRNDVERYGMGLLNPLLASQASAWAPGESLFREPFVQVDLGHERPLLALLVRGRSTLLGPGAFVTELRLEGSLDGLSWRVVADALPGSTDAKSVHFQLLRGTKEQRLARFVRIIPLQFSGDGHWPHMSAALVVDRA